MPMHAIALIRGRTIPEGLSGHALDDASLVRTAIRFDLEPSDLAAALVARLGDAFGDDARGVFVVPDVALEEAKTHQTFDAVVEGIGEAGMWVRRADVGDTAEDRVLGRDAVIGEIFDGKPISFEQLQALLGQSAGGDDDEDDEDDDDVERTMHDGEDDEDGTETALDAPVDLEALMSSPALRGVIERLAASVASSPETQSELEQAAARGMDLESLANSPGIAQLMQSMMEELGKSPEAMQALFGQGGGEGDDD